nr:MAG TPA: hypothetical protein [Caudoviricetes sp.]
MKSQLQSFGHQNSATLKKKFFFVKRVVFLF